MSSKLLMILIMAGFVIGLYIVDNLLDKYNQNKD